VIVNNGAVMRVKVKNDQMISGQWLKPGEVVMIPNNKAVKEFEDLGIAEVVKWRTRKVSDVQKVGPTENTALKPIRETMTISKSEVGSSGISGRGSFRQQECQEARAEETEVSHAAG